ncbi:unnamed protein product [Phaedon cochleariae]|uniref:Uncharacterized protein n=1 Tax=Phaedon cochleariae TaxID=80249 RepID=A0A9N9SK18_PHACE|nr:unnamed protein product [Phaedon cochleariae]
MAAAAVETSEEVVEEADDGEAAAEEEAELCQELLVTVSETGLPEASAAAAELKRQLERERGLRSILEEQVRQLETQLFQQQAQQQTQIFEVDDSDAIGLQLLAADSLPPVGHTQTVGCSPPNSRSVSPAPPLAVNVVSTAVAVEQRLPSVLEAAIKAEPKVEVERLPTTTASSGHEDPATASRIYVSNTTRQNLETIVEAIRHLEGDHMFGDEPHAQDAPLALTTHAQRTPDSVLKADMQNYLDFNAARLQQHQQSRPGVIVVKQAS